MNLQDWGKPIKFIPMEETVIRQELILMESNPELDTRISLAKGEDSSLHLVTFQEKHLSYLRQHPKVNPKGYLVNLKTMIKIRSEK